MTRGAIVTNDTYITNTPYYNYVLLDLVVVRGCCVLHIFNDISSVNRLIRQSPALNGTKQMYLLSNIAYYESVGYF